MGMLISDYNREMQQTAVGVASAADVYTWMPGGPVEIVRFGIVANTSAFMATATSSFSMRVDINSKTSATVGYTRTSGAVGTLTVTDSTVIDQPGNGVYTNTSSGITVKMGEQVIFAVTSAATAAATARVFCEYRDLPWQGHGRPTSAPGDGASSGNIANMTKV